MIDRMPSRFDSMAGALAELFRIVWVLGLLVLFCFVVVGIAGGLQYYFDHVAVK